MALVAAATKQPDGQIFAFVVGQITFKTSAILSPKKGRWPSSRTLGRDAVDAAASCARWDGRAAFGPVSDPWDVRTSGAEAYGEVVWSWRLSGWRQVCGRQVGPTGRGCAGYSQATETTSPILRGERVINRKAIAQGMPECLR